MICFQELSAGGENFSAMVQRSQFFGIDLGQALQVGGIRQHFLMPEHQPVKTGQEQQDKQSSQHPMNAEEKNGDSCRSEKNQQPQDGDAVVLLSQCQRFIRKVNLSLLVFVFQFLHLIFESTPETHFKSPLEEQAEEYLEKLFKLSCSDFSE